MSADTQRLRARTSRATAPEPSWVRLPSSTQSPQDVVRRVLRAVREPSWAPDTSARDLVRDIDDALVLRRARALLRVVTRHQINPTHARAFATISMALDQLEERLASSREATASGPESRVTASR